MAHPDYDSAFCGSLPLHLSNLIQDYGVLLVVGKNDYRIVQVSENAELVFGESAEGMINKGLSDILNEEAFSSLHARVKEQDNHNIPAIWNIHGNSLLALVHNKPDYLIIELDRAPLMPSERETFIAIHQEVKYVMSRIEGAASIAEACTTIATELKRISGFDKVMIYRFDEHWNGTVIAEAKESSMDPFLDVTFPASDIPKPARELYFNNPYRLIPDRAYRPVRLFPVINPITNSFIDLSDCNLRSVAAVHIEYLKNMDVTASMSTRILVDDALWGLIACHHRTPRYLNYEMCSVFEMLSSVVSIKISSLQYQEMNRFENMINGRYARMIESIYKSERRINKVLLEPEGVLTLFSADGVALVHNNSTGTAGHVPPPDFIEDLVLWLHTRRLRTILSTDCLSADFENAAQYADTASGLLVIPLRLQSDDYIILFRKEFVKVVNWGGNPEERIQFDKTTKAYHPRNSFRQWQQKVRGTSLPWRKDELRVAEALRSFMYEYLTTA